LIATGGRPGTFAWSPTAGLSDPSAGSPRAAPVVNTQYVLQSGSPGCTTTDTVAVTVISASTSSFALSASNSTICPGDPVTITASGGNSYQWLGNSSGSTSTVAVSPSATTQYAVRIQSSNNSCSAVDTLYTTISVKPAPTIKATKSGDINCVTLQVELQASGGVQYQWSPAAGLSSAIVAKPIVRVTEQTQYIVVGKGSNGCSSTDTVTVSVLNTGSPMYFVPNSFTPNNDGLNDCFGIKNWGGVSKFQFSVYHRWGGIIFSTTDPLKCWNGMIKGTPAPSGVYIYSVKASTICGEVEKSGTVTLIR
jgi:gliding motility-associated-like protein